MRCHFDDVFPQAAVEIPDAKATTKTAILILFLYFWAF
jgi:hypothetical protein